MKKNVKNALVIVVALALVIVVGKYSADHRLKATDGEENVVTEVTETVTEATEQVEEIVIESAPVELSTEELVTEEAIEEATEEVTEAETEETAEVETETETEVDTSNCSIEVTSNVEHSDNLTEGTKITLTATLSGFENIEYTLQWQKSLDGENWEDISGANAEIYTFTLNDDTGRYYWKAVAITD